MNGVEFEDIVRSMVSERLFIHSRNVAALSMELAEIYGCDKQYAGIAGILHDILKETDSQILLQTIFDSDIILSKVEMNEPNLWHSIAASVYIKKEFGVTDESIINAVRYHTSGRKNMSMLEKIIYIADCTSVERTYNGVDDLRKLAKKDIDSAIKKAVAFTVSDLVLKGHAICNDTIDAYNEFVMGK